MARNLCKIFEINYLIILSLYIPLYIKSLHILYCTIQILEISHYQKQIIKTKFFFLKYFHFNLFQQNS